MFENSLKFIAKPTRKKGKPLHPRKEEGTESQISKLFNWHWLPMVWGFGFQQLGPWRTTVCEIRSQNLHDMASELEVSAKAKTSRGWGCTTSERTKEKKNQHRGQKLRKETFMFRCGSWWGKKKSLTWDYETTDLKLTWTWYPNLYCQHDPGIQNA